MSSLHQLAYLADSGLQRMQKQIKDKSPSPNEQKDISFRSSDCQNNKHGSFRFKQAIRRFLMDWKSYKKTNIPFSKEYSLSVVTRSALVPPERKRGPIWGWNGGEKKNRRHGAQLGEAEDEGEGGPWSCGHHGHGGHHHRPHPHAPPLLWLPETKALQDDPEKENLIAKD